MEVNETSAFEARPQQIPIIDLESPCTFECLGCGWRCCSDRKDILVTPYNLLRISWWLHSLAEDYPAWAEWLSTLLASAFVIEQGCSSLMPLALVDFKPTKSGHTVCPFLVPADTIADNQGVPSLIRALRTGFAPASLSVCGIYDVRPNMCRLFPLARFGVPGEEGRIDWKYVLQDVSCGRHGLRLDGLTWAEWIDEDEQAQNTEGLNLYTSMIEAVRQQLVHAGVQTDVWLNDKQIQAVLCFVFYGFPIAVLPPRDQRTHETAMRICRASADLLPQVVEALLQGRTLDFGELFDALPRGITV